MMQRGPGSWAVVTVALLVVAAAIWLVLGRSAPMSLQERAAIAPQTAQRDDADEPQSGRAPGARIPLPGREALDADDAGSLEQGDLGSWEEDDLEAVRAAMPDNLYRKLAAPTKDEQVIEARAAERERWNVEYGKILSGNATEEEIRAYYDHRARISGGRPHKTLRPWHHVPQGSGDRPRDVQALLHRLALARSRPHSTS